MKFLAPIWLFVLVCLPLEARDRWTVADYFQVLPPAYRAFYADVGSQRRVIDERNGYLAIHAEGWDGPLFEMALFRDARGEAVVLTSNTQSDPACIFYATHALRYREGAWEPLPSLLPSPDPNRFFPDPADRAVAKKAPDYLAWHYHLPRLGTELKLTFAEPCAMVEGLSDSEYARFTELRSRTVQRFRWHREQRVFKAMR